MSIFSQVAIPKIKSSVFNLSEEAKLSCNAGELIPILCKEVLPHDKFKLSTELLIKLAPLKSPMFHRVKAKVDYFFVPTYQICDAFSDFINPKVNTASNPIVLPYLTPLFISNFGSRQQSMIGTLSDYLGLPVTQTSWFSNQTQKISVLPFIAYQHIYNEYYRDQNLEPIPGEGIYEAGPLNIDIIKTRTGNLSNFGSYRIQNLLSLRNCCWKKDYFTSALPSPQAGDDVMLPIGSDGVVELVDDLEHSTQYFVNDAGEPIDPDYGSFVGAVANSETVEHGSISNNRFHGEGKAFLDPNGSMKVSGSQNAISINDFRKLFSLQKFKELAERGGTRYPEFVRNFFGAFLPDFYYNRPKYLGGQVQYINIGEVVSTTDSTNTPFGQRAGVGASYGKTKTVQFKSPCHGFIMGILRILPEATYSQGVERMWTRETIYDFAFPQFANLGEQEIRNKEIFASGTDSQDNGVFGYTPRYAEYKEGHCHIAGVFRTSLAYWHMGRTFSNAPALNKSFVGMGAINYSPFYITDSGTEHFYVNLYNNIIARRPLPYFGSPSGL